METSPFKQSVERYESWMRSELGDELVEADLARKHELMRSGPFPFLRATFWRWCERLPSICDGIALDKVPHALAVGDIHLENYGTWRDNDGRLVWGVNDYDEAAIMPYLVDLLRLATSAEIAASGRKPLRSITLPILDGYRKGLDNPRPWVLDGSQGKPSGPRHWLREQTIVPEAERQAFWDKLEGKREEHAKRGGAGPQPRYLKALLAALPAGSTPPDLFHRAAGLGSLGRPRWVARAIWRGGLVVREAKAALPSGWTLVNKGTRAIRSMEIGTGRFRAPDPWYGVADGISVRRLSPNNRKIEAAGSPSAGKAGTEVDKKLGLDTLLDPIMLSAMGRDLAAIHLGTDLTERDLAGQIEADLRRRDDDWLERLTEKAVRAVRKDFEAWK